MSDNAIKGGAGAGGSKQHDYYGSIAGIVCQGRLDYIWGLTLDGKLLWPAAVVLDGTLTWAVATDGITFHTGVIVAWSGRLWEALADTTTEPPSANWKLFRRLRTDIGTNPYKFTVENFGDAYLYWGLADQVLDTVNEQFLDANGHPPYRNRAVLALKNFLFGTERPTPPNPTVLGGRIPQQTVVTGDAALEDAEWRVNPWCFILELLTDRVIGLGRPDADFDSTSWQAQADWALTNHDLTYIAPLYDRQQSVRSLVADLLQYSDGFLYWTEQGTIAAGHWPHGEAAPAFTAANTIDIHDLVEPVNWTADTWRDTTNATIVTYSDINYAFNSVPAKASNLFNRAATRRVQSRNIDRPFIIYPSQAAALAAEDAKLNGEPKFTGELLVRAEKVTAITIGSLFRLTDDSQSLSRACRCTKRVITAPPAGTVKITFETERGLAELPYSATPVTPTPAANPAPVRISDFEFIQIPPQLSRLATDHPFVCLAGRDNSLTTRLGVWWKNADSAAFEELVHQTGWAVYGTVNAGINTQNVTGEVITSDSLLGTTYPLAHQNVWGLTLHDDTASYDAVEGTDFIYDAAAGTVTIIDNTNLLDGDQLSVGYSTQISLALAGATPAEDIERISATLTDDEIANNTLLLFLLKNGDSSNFEILSIKSIVAAGSGNYTLTAVRALYGTEEGGDGAYVFTTSDRAFLIFRAGLTPFTHEAFATLAAAESTVTFRLTPATAWLEADVTDVYNAGTNPNGLATEASYSFLDPYPPVVTWNGVFANTGAGGAYEAVTDFSTVFDPGTRFRLMFSVTDRNADLTAFSISYYLGGNTGNLISTEQVAATALVTRTVEFTLADPGEYRVIVNAKDSTGRVTDQFLTAVGGSTEVTLLTQAGTPTQVLPPTFVLAGSKHPQIRCTLTCATAGATIYYQIQPKDIAVDSGSWVTYTSGYIYYNSSSQCVYAYATASGLADSEIVVQN